MRSRRHDNHDKERQACRHALDCMLWDCLVSGMAGFPALSQAIAGSKEIPPPDHAGVKSGRARPGNKAAPDQVSCLHAADRRSGRTR